MSDVLVNIIESKKADEGASISFSFPPLATEYIYSVQSKFPRFINFYCPIISDIFSLALVFSHH